MTAIAGAVMVGSAGLCLSGAVHARRLLGIIAATVMLCSMIDLAYFSLLPAVLWAGLLVLAAILLGFDLRVGTPDEKHMTGVEALQKVGKLSESLLHRAVMVASTLAYPAAAWLALTHDHSGSTTSTGVTAPANGHVHGSAGLLSSAPNIAIALLILTLAALSALALRRRRIALVVESCGMAVMLAVMLF